MRIPKGTWIGGVAVVSVAGLLSNSADLLILSAFAAAVGVIGEVLVAHRNHRRQDGDSGAIGVNDLEERLLAAETALAMATRELTSLKEDSGAIARVHRKD